MKPAAPAASTAIDAGLSAADVAPDHAQRRHLRQLQHRRQAEGHQQGQAHTQPEQRRPHRGSGQLRRPPGRPAARRTHSARQSPAARRARLAQTPITRELHQVLQRDAALRRSRARAASRSRRGARLAKSRAAMPTATAASKAASKATRLRNFSARSSVWRISGRPLASDSMRRPRSVCALDLRLGPLDECAHRRVARTAGRHGQPVVHAAGGLDQAGGGQVGLVQHHAWRKAHEARAAVGFDDDDLRDAQRGVAQQQRVADLQVEGVEQRRVDPDAAAVRARAPGSLRACRRRC